LEDVTPGRLIKGKQYWKFCSRKSANKRMVLTLPARGSFSIIARYKSLGACTNALLPVKARVGRTCEALANVLSQNLQYRIEIVLLM
jgi:hypothetical protein